MTAISTAEIIKLVQLNAKVMEMLSDVAESEVVLNGTKQPHLVIKIDRFLWERIKQIAREDSL